MQLTLAVDGDADGQETGTLRDWIRRDRSLRGRLSTPAGTDTPPGAMGSLELLNVVVSNGIALGNLLLAVGAWRLSRPSPPSVRITVNGGEIVVETSDPGVLAALARTVREADGTETDN